MASVRLQQVSKVYAGGITALEHIDLDVADGEIVALVGPSGCGKTTLLRIVAGLEPPTAGSVEIDGKNVDRVPPDRRNVAMVFQDYALYPQLDVRRNLAFGVERQGIDRQEVARRISEVVEWLKIEPLLGRRPGELSGGERQRTALGRAVVRRPRVFLLDEPLANLDVELRDRARTELAALHERLAATILYVTHDQQEAMALGQRVAVMNQGRLQQVASPREVYQSPVNRFVARFMSRPAMNFAAGEVKGQSLLIGNREVRVPIASAIADRPVELGVRAEDLLVSGEGYSLGEALVERVEWLGADTLLHLRLGELRWISRVASKHSIASNSTTPVAIRVGGAHLFALDSSGERLLTQ